MKTFIAYLVAFIFLFESTVSAQQDINAKTEIGLSGSGFIYHGDLSKTRLGHWKDVRFGAGVYAKRYLSPILAVRANVYRGSLSGNDCDFQEEWRQKRAFQFSTSLTEVSVMAEADIFGQGRFRSFRESGKHHHRWGAYLFAGVGVVFTNASRNWSELNRQYFYKDAPEKIAQDSLNTPDKMSLVVPAGFGVRYDISRHVSMFAEVGYRFTITDNLDGYKYAVYSSKYDGYTTYSFGVSYRFDRDTRYRRQMLIQ